MLTDDDKDFVNSWRDHDWQHQPPDHKDVSEFVAIIERLQSPAAVLAEAERLLRQPKTRNGVMRVHISMNDCGCCESFVRVGVDEIAKDFGEAAPTLYEAYAKLMERDEARKGG